VAESAGSELPAALAALADGNSKLRLSALPMPDAAIAASGADLAVITEDPGAPPVEHSIVVRRQPLAIVLPITLAPDDLTLPQAIDLLTGGVRDWQQLGTATARPIHLAVADPGSLASVGALAGRSGGAPAGVRSAAAATLLGETEAGSDEAVVVPWDGPRLKSKALRIDGRFPDDPGYALAIDTLLVPLSTEAQTVVGQIGPALAARLAPSRSGTVTVDAMGDFMLARGVAAQIQRNGPDFPFAKVVDRLRGADVRFGNLEFSLTDRGEQAHKDYTFRTPPGAAQSLTTAGINIVDLANNHVLDYGGQGLLDTLGALNRTGVLETGAGADAERAHTPTIVQVNGLRIAWLAYVNVPDDSITGFVARSLEAGPGRPGVAWGTTDAIRRDVAAAKQSADVVIVALHSGYEYTSDPNSIQRDLAHAAIDAGAALVLGAHPHVLQGIEYYRGGIIAYSLGNFIFDLDESDIAHYGLPSVLTMVLRVTLDAHGVTGLQIYPAIINRNDYRPEPVVGQAARPVFDRIEQLTNSLHPYGGWSN
jgi:poly-gamma-glutamate synthesis protein (capsule biosynthesis protein)